jgi:hypothetical protein
MIVVTTRSSVYELIVLPGHNDVLVRGGSHFPEFRRALFLGSTAADGSFVPGTFQISGRLRFVCGDLLFVTSAVESVSLAICDPFLKDFAAALGDAARSPACGSPDVFSAA